MQIHALRIKAYRHWHVDDHTSPEAFERERILHLYARLRADGSSAGAALAAASCSRVTLWRWPQRWRAGGVAALADHPTKPRRVRHAQWSREHEHQVWDLRRRYPFMGRWPLQVLLRRGGIELSASTLGRILAKGVRLGRIRPCAFYQGRVQAKRRRDFGASHAQRWRDGAKARAPGDLVQIDHMTVQREGQMLKEFRAISPVGKRMVARVYARATARHARRFLEAVAAEMPLHSIQVDGGSEFMAECETSCAARGIPLHVLPPRRPQWNGCVERANGTARMEFWNLYDGDLTVAEAGPALADYQRFYNEVRPHSALNYQTPMEYLHMIEHNQQAA